MIFNNITNSIFKKLLDGTIAAGNANKLGGKGASEYALAEELTKRKLNYISCATLDEIYIAYANIHNNAGDDTVYEAEIYHTVPHPTMGSGIYHVTGFRANVLYGWQIATSYAFNTQFLRILAGGIWRDWFTFATTADLANYLPNSDGTISGSLIFKTVDNGYTQMTKAHGSDYDNGTAIYDYDSSGNYVALVLQRANGLLRYYDDHGGKDILHEGNVGKYKAGYATELAGNDSGSIISVPNIGGARLDGPLNSATVGSLPVANNANAVLTIHRHFGNYVSQLGFSSDNTLYYRSFDDEVISATKPWRQLIDTGSSAKVVISPSAPLDTSALWVW